MSLHKSRAQGEAQQTAGPHAEFIGFAAPTSNTTFAPNQFFDVCLPHYSRGVVRLVAFLIRKTLGWCDRNGDPQEEQINFSYSALIGAGISRDMIRSSSDEATKGNFVEFVQPRESAGAGRTGQHAVYQLKWSADAEYVKKPDQFRGFFEAGGNRTDIPNQFFDVVFPNEPLSVIKVVGAIIRFSIGFVARHGHQRQQVAISYSEIQRYTKIASRDDLSRALRVAQERNYIVRLEDGIFSPFDDTRRKATYALRWADFPTSRKSEPANQSEIRTNNAVGNPNQYTNDT